MAVSPITILWEDELGVERQGFGPQRLLNAALVVGRGKGESRFDLGKAIKANPKKGAGSLRKALKRDGARLLANGPVFAVLDGDRVRTAYQESEGICRSQLKAKMQSEAPGVEFVLLEKNTETLVDLCCKVLPRQQPAGKPTPNERDKVLNAAADLFERDPEKLAQFLAACPSFERLVKKVQDALACRLPG
jgi:hypothetical protein